MNSTGEIRNNKFFCFRSFVDLNCSHRPKSIVMSTFGSKIGSVEIVEMPATVCACELEMVKLFAFLTIETNCNPCKCNYSVWIGRAHQDFPITRDTGTGYARQVISNSMKILLAGARPRRWCCHFKAPKWIPYVRALEFLYKAENFRRIIAVWKIYCICIEWLCCPPLRCSTPVLCAWTRCWQPVKYANVKCGNCGCSVIIAICSNEIRVTGERAWVGSSHSEIIDFVHRNRTHRKHNVYWLMTTLCSRGISNISTFSEYSQNEKFICAANEFASTTSNEEFFFIFFIRWNSIYFEMMQTSRVQ